jgi:hypothetical protein
MRRALTAIAFAAVFSMFGEARAADTPLRCPTPNGASTTLASHDARSRFLFLQSQIHDQAKRAFLWSSIWSFTGVAIAGESTALAVATVDEKKRIIWLAQGLPALGFPGLILIDPLKVMADDRELKEITEADPEQTKLCANLARAEQLFAEDAADEKRKTGIFSHALCVLANLASSTVIVLATGDWTSAILNGVGGEAVSELNLWTLPTGAESALDRYRAGDLTTNAIAPSPVVTSATARGLNLTISW